MQTTSSTGGFDLKRHNGKCGISENLKYEYDKNGNKCKNHHINIQKIFTEI